MRFNDILGVSDAEAAGFQLWRTQGSVVAAAPVQPPQPQATRPPWTYSVRDVAMETHPVLRHAFAPMRTSSSTSWVPVAVAWLLGLVTAWSVV